MKTKNIFKTLALAMLMPAMLLTTACSNEDDALNNTANTENTINKGYALPVTVNVTRQDDATTRATYNESTRKLEFSEGDKLFVSGSATGAGSFAGTLEYVSAGTFSGTIYTEIPYEGTIDDLLNGNYATLLPAGYDSYDYLEIIDEGYEALLGENAYNSFATSKKLGVEQLSFEHGEYTSGTGFVLEPRNAILNFTITGLTASTNVTATLSDDEDWTPDIEGEVTTNESGTATFAIGLEGSSDLNEFSLSVAGNAITLVNSSKTLEAGKIYNISRNVLIVNPVVGQVIGNNGKNYADADAAEADGATAVAKIVYVGSDNGEAAPYNHGLALALSNANSGSSCKWKTSNTDAGHTKHSSSTFTEESGLQYNDATHNSDTYPAFKAAIANNGTAAPTGCSAWFLASGYQWQKMASAAGLTNLGLTEGAAYWSSSERDASQAWVFLNGNWYNINKNTGFRVLACLAF